MASTSIFIRIDDGVLQGSATSIGTKGESDAKEAAENYERWIFAETLSFGVKRDSDKSTTGGSGTTGGGAGTAAPGGGGGAGASSGARSTAEPVRIKKRLDMASCGLMG